MKWDDMTPEQQNRLIAEKIMGYETGEMPSGTVMMWSEDGLMAEIPRYTQSLDAAWLVLKRFYEDNQDGELFSPLAYHLGVTYWEQAYNSDVFQMNLEQLVSLTPEKLCYAILKTGRIEERK